jgi:hypothetical protein
VWRFAFDDTPETGGPRDEWQTALELADGESILLRLSVLSRPQLLWGTYKGVVPTKDKPVHHDPPGAEMTSAIVAARAAWLERQHGQGAEEHALARGAGTGREWLHALRRVGADGARGYRGVTLDLEQLSRLLDDPRTRPVVRAAAAVALAGSGDAAAVRKLRIAATSVANPRLRIALDHIVDARDEAAIAAALDALHEAEATEPGAVAPRRARRSR